MKNNLKKLRLERGYTQSWLAQAVGTTKKTIYAIETQDQDIHISLAHKLAVILGCSMDDLYTFEDSLATTADKAIWYVHVVRYVAEQLKKPIRDTTKLLEQSGLAQRVISGYSVWHTQGYEYMAEMLADEINGAGA